MDSGKRVCSNDSGEGGSFDDLPKDLLFQIFLKLPPKSIMDDLIWVCKSWYRLAHNPDYHMNMNGNDNGQRFLVYDNKKPNAVSFALLNTTDMQAESLGDLTEGDLEVESNCNGLLCLSHKKNMGGHPIMIYNPKTKCRITLPPFHEELGDIFYSMHTLCFDYSPTTYKVIWTFQKPLSKEKNYYMITVGRQDSWKRLSPPQGVQQFLSSSAYWNGTIFWTSRVCLLAFDVCVESFQVINFPQENFCSNRLRLLHMGDYLALVEYVGSKFRLWKVIPGVGTYSFTLKHECDTRESLDQGTAYEVVGELEDGLLLQLLADTEKVRFAKFIPGATTGCEVINIRIPGMHGRSKTLLSYKLSLVSPKLI